MKLFTCEHDGHWLGGESIVLAKSRERAEELMRNELERRGFKTTFSMKQIPQTKETVIMLNDGDY